jgi:transcriptional regulator with XRE-family HTH domain
MTTRKRKTKGPMPAEAAYWTATEWGRFIRQLRKRMYLRQLDLAIKVGVRKLEVSRWERGAHLPIQETQRKLLKIAGFRPPGREVVKQALLELREAR